jgi:hypothetical protein
LTVQEVYNQVLQTLNDIDFRKFKTAYNECQSILGSLYDTAVYEKSQIIDAEDTDDWVDLPSDCIGITRVYTSDGYEYSPYIAQMGMIKFGARDTFTVHYQAKLVNIATLTDTVTLHDLFIPALIQYIIYKNVDSKVQENAYALFNNISDKADVRLRSIKRKNKIIKARRWA